MVLERVNQTNSPKTGGLYFFFERIEFNGKLTDYPHLEEGTDVENSPIKHIPIGPPCPHKSVAACKNKSDANFPP